MQLLLPLFMVACVHCAPKTSDEKPGAESPQTKLAELTSMTQLTTLRSETVATQLMTTCYWLAQASGNETPPAESLAAARRLNGTPESHLLKETEAALVRNLETLQNLGCLDAPGRARLRNGAAPVIRTGPYAGANVSVLHTIAPSRVSDLTNQLFNLEFVADPAQTETAPEHQLEFARRWHWMGLLDARGYAAVVYAFPSRGADK